MTELFDKVAYKNELPCLGCEKLYLDMRTADVFFVFDALKVPAHKAILSANSSVFDAMFYGPSKEDGNEIIVTGVTAAQFKEFLQFFYLSSVKLTVKNKSKIMYLGEKYMLNVCKQVSVELLNETLELDNICWAYQFAMQFKQDDVKKICELKISENPAKIFQSKSFLMSKPNVLHAILQLDSLECDESVVFDGCIAWAKAECKRKGVDDSLMDNIRSQLGKSFYEIRFGDMSLDRFYTRANSYDGLFSMDEYKHIIGMIANANLYPTEFNCKPRIMICDRIDPLKSYSEEIYANKSIDGVDYTVFTSNRSLLLTKIYFSDLLCHNNNVQHVNVQIEIIVLLKKCASYIPTTVIHSREITTNPRQDTIVELQPIVIKPDINYGISFSLSHVHMKTVKCKSLLAYKDKVDIGHGTIIEFHDYLYNNGPCLLYSNKKVSLVKKMVFLKDH